MKRLNLKSSKQTTGTALIPEEERTKIRQTKKGSFINNLLYYIIAVVCTTAFFVHEFVPDQSSEYINVVQKHKTAKAKRTAALKSLKDSQKGTELHDLYLIEKKNTDLVWKEYLEVKEKDKFLDFKNLQQFLGEFGWALGLFIYSLFNVIIAFIRRSISFRGEMVLHSTLIFISLYFISWAFYVKLPDYSKTHYIFYSALMTIFMVYGTNLLVNQKKKYISALMTNIRDLIGFVFKNTKPESQEKMWDVLNKVEHERN